MKLSELDEMRARSRVKSDGPISLLYGYNKQHLENLVDMLKFLDGSKVVRSLDFNDFGPLTQKHLAFTSDAQETEYALLENGCILVAELHGEHHYSEHTMESAYISYTGYTPKEANVSSN